MDKESSVNCTRVTLIVCNLLCLLLGVTGFIIGFARPSLLYHVSISGTQLSMASLCLIWGASLGLMAAVTLNYHLLLAYAALILGSFLVRIVWSITAYIHSTVFILDCSASTTILSTIGAFFLMLFALLLANTKRNEDATSKAKLIRPISVSPVNGAAVGGAKNSILKGTLNNNLKKGHNQKNILTSVNTIQTLAPASASASPSPTTLNQSSLSTPISQQSSQKQQQPSRLQQQTRQTTTSNHRSQHNQHQPPISKSSSSKQSSKHNKRNTSSAAMIV